MDCCGLDNHIGTHHFDINFILCHYGCYGFGGVFSFSSSTNLNYVSKLWKSKVYEEKSLPPPINLEYNYKTPKRCWNTSSPRSNRVKRSIRAYLIQPPASKMSKCQSKWQNQKCIRRFHILCNFQNSLCMSYSPFENKVNYDWKL